MKGQSITAAPQLTVTDDLYSRWLESHTGTMDDFIRFLCTPGPERSDFLAYKDPVVTITEGVGTATYSE